MKALEQQLSQAVNLIQEANNIVALTGAGISTPSGIPDFRSPDSGLWDKSNPIEVASIFAFQQEPQKFYDWIRPLAAPFLVAKPNPAHHALRKLEEAGKLTAIITQNIDGLHQAAGSKAVYELHGHFREVTCTRCYKTRDSASALAEFLEKGEAPFCDCGGVFKPNVILFGEQLPAQEFVAAQKAVQGADLLLVVGSSLEVAPASDLPLIAKEAGAKLIIINYQSTYLDSEADIVIHEDVAESLPQITDLALKKR